MPLLSVQEVEQMLSLPEGRLGDGIAERIMQVLSLDRVNALYDCNRTHRGADFASAVLEDIGCGYVLQTEGPDAAGDLEDFLPEGPFITVSNHPCGHIDGIALIDIFAHLRPDYRLMVNGILSRIEPLQDHFISVTPAGAEHSSPSALSLKGVRQSLSHLRDGGCLGLFPSGAVSDLSVRDGCVRDREWQEPVIRLIMKAGVPVVPVRFFDGNSALYYALGCIGWKVRLLRLPAEVFNKKGKEMRIGIGREIYPDQIRGLGDDPLALRDYLRACVYGMRWQD